MSQRQFRLLWWLHILLIMCGAQVGQNDDLGVLALQFCKEHSIDVGEAANIAMELYNARQGAEEAEAGEGAGTASQAAAQQLKQSAAAAGRPQGGSGAGQQGQLRATCV